MELTTVLVLASVVAIVQLFFRYSSTPSKHGYLQWIPRSSRTEAPEKYTREFKTLHGEHEVEKVLNDLVREDGAGSWPPVANHTLSHWPVPLQPYRHLYLELAALLPQAIPSLDDQVNAVRIAEFRRRVRILLNERIDLAEIHQLMQAADAGRWEYFPREVYNAFYCCIASSRHAYRWGTIPVVKIAQLEKEVDLPTELVVPWAYMQRHFGCLSDAGNITANRVLNFDMQGNYMYRINTGMSQKIQNSEEAFARIFYDVETFGAPIYRDMVHAIIAFEKGDKTACARHVANISSQMRRVLSVYFDRLHDKMVARSVWLPYVQGFDGWGVGHYDEAKKEWVKYNGLSGNQLLLFQALDAFLGIDQYLSSIDQERNIPKRQRDLCHVLRKHSFRGMLSEMGGDEDEVAILRSMDDIVKKLRTFRAAHRVRSKIYLSQDAPERAPMTAGKSTLGGTIEEGIAFLDEFMVRRFEQTV